MKIKEMNLHQLEDEINSMEQSMEISGHGVKDVMYLDALYNEADSRGYDIQSYKSVTLKGDE